jgi:hypothetical protein
MSACLATRRRSYAPPPANCAHLQTLLQVLEQRLAALPGRVVDPRAVEFCAKKVSGAVLAHVMLYCSSAVVSAAHPGPLRQLLLLP